MSLDPTRQPGDPPRRDRTAEGRRVRSSFIGVSLLAAMGFVVLASFDLLPAAWWVLLVASWLGALVVAVRSFMTAPRRVLLAPVVVFVAWLGAVLLTGR